MTGATWCSIFCQLWSAFYVSETRVQSLPNYHIACKWLWHSGTMALSEWLGGSPLGQRWAGIMKSRWFPVYCLGKRTGNWRRTSHREQNMAPRGPLPYSQKNGGKKPKNVAGETGAGRRHGAIHFISRKRKPTAFYILKTGNFYQITPRNGASCSNLLNSNIGIFFPISPQGKIFSPQTKNKHIFTHNTNS